MPSTFDLVTRREKRKTVKALSVARELAGMELRSMAASYSIT